MAGTIYLDTKFKEKGQLLKPEKVIKALLKNGFSFAILVVPQGRFSRPPKYTPLESTLILSTLVKSQDPIPQDAQIGAI